jgi:type IV secretion system protein VirB1
MIALPALIQHCVPSIAQKQMIAIVQVETKGNPLALNLNNGYKLQFQPHSKTQAQKWVEYLDKYNYNFDIGLAQINIKNVNKYRYKVTELLDPCTNLKLASSILIKNYTSALPSSKSSDEAWQKAISAYNTGNFHSGFANDYVRRVYASINKMELTPNDNNSDIPLIIDNHTKKNKIKVPSISDTVSSQSNPYSSRSLLYIQQKKATASEINSIKVTYNAPAT